MHVQVYMYGNLYNFNYLRASTWLLRTISNYIYTWILWDVCIYIILGYFLLY